MQADDARVGHAGHVHRPQPDHQPRVGLRRPSRRPALALAALVTTASGLAVRTISSGTASQLGGDVLYAVLVYLLVVLVAVRLRPVVGAGVAWGLCAVVELAQLAGLSAAVVAVWEPARWVLGTTFGAPDLLVYAVGAAAAAAIDAACTRDLQPGRALQAVEHSEGVARPYPARAEDLHDAPEAG